MANSIINNPFILDTTATITTDSLRIKKVRWVNATTAGHTCSLTDVNNNVYWESVASGSNYVEETDFSEITMDSNLLNGLQLTLSSGKVYIYK
jgi:hypothetical protein